MKKKPESTKKMQPRMPEKPLRKNDEATLKSSGDIVKLILRDHEPLKKLIEVLKDGEKEREQKEETLEKFVAQLVPHAKAEERSLYVQMKDDKELRTEGYEGDTEHAIAEQLVHEINATPDDDEWNAKVKVLAELVEHHIEDEENEILPEVEKKFSAEDRRGLGARYTELKDDIELLQRPRLPRLRGGAERRLQ